nr:sedoheptulose 7-phosphate cyclase [Pseudanabaena sp. FACHB-1998]
MVEQVTVCGNIKFRYLIEFERDVFSLGSKKLTEYCEGRDVLVVVSSTVYDILGCVIEECFSKRSASVATRIVSITDSENDKNIEHVLGLCKVAKTVGIDRKGIFIAVGGGVLMDMVGLAASIYRRKVDYIRVPTTLLGQVDAAVGIKTAVNFDGHKNLIGSFHPPMAVFNDVKLLASLPVYQSRCGLAEIVKMAISLDRGLFNKIEPRMDSIIKPKLDNDWNFLEEVIAESTISMVEQIESNFYEADLARYVDFGHTFSPVIEEDSQYQIGHGHAVAMDMALSTQLSFDKGWLAQEDRDRIIKVLMRIGLEVRFDLLDEVDRLWYAIEKIMEHRGALNLVVPVEIGKSTFIRDLKTIDRIDLVNSVNGLRKFYEN